MNTKLAIAGCLAWLLSIGLAAGADELKMPPLPGDTIDLSTTLAPAVRVSVGHVNQMAELISLTHTDRKPRTFKHWGYLIPGKVYRYQYLWILEDGNGVTKMESFPIKGVRDDRPLNESHPNLYIGYLGCSAFGGAAAGAIMAGVK